MTTSGHAWRERWAFCNPRLRHGTFELAVKGALLTPNPAHLTAVARCVPTDAHASHAAVARAEQSDLGAERILITVLSALEMLDTAWNSHATNFYEGTATHSHIIRIRVRRIKLWWQTNSPAFVRIDRLRHEMEIFSLCINQSAEIPRPINFSHGVQLFV